MSKIRTDVRVFHARAEVQFCKRVPGSWPVARDVVPISDVEITDDTTWEEVQSDLIDLVYHCVGLGPLTKDLWEKEKVECVLLEVVWNTKEKKENHTSKLDKLSCAKIKVILDKMGPEDKFYLVY